VASHRASKSVLLKNAFNTQLQPSDLSGVKLNTAQKSLG